MGVCSLKTKISLIVPVYNTEKYVEQCLESIKNQTLHDIEVIVVDDGSTDSSSSLCNTFQEDSRFLICHNNNQGLSASRNYGISKASGEYCMFVDSDDWLELTACEKMYGYAVETGADLVIGGYVNESTAGGKIRYIFPKNHLFENEDYKENILIHTLGLIGMNIKNPAKLDALTPVWARLYRTSIIKENSIEFIDLKKIPSEALQFNLEFAVNAKRAIFLHEVVYHYRRNTIQSVTKPYRDDLSDKWDWWIKYTKGYLKYIEADSDLWEAYYSRVCCSIIPVGGNAIKLGGYFKIKNEVRTYLEEDFLINAFTHFDYSSCPIYWRLFFWSAKTKKVDLFIILTKCMRLLLKRRKA
jgi:glycosyltransferase EpsH